MNDAIDTRVDCLRRIFEEQGFGDLELLEAWNGEELEDLREFLSDEEFEVLLDQLAEARER